MLFFKKIGLQLLVLQPCVTKSDEEAPSLKALVSDPYILIAAGKLNWYKPFFLHFFAYMNTYHLWCG